MQRRPFLKIIFGFCSSLIAAVVGIPVLSVFFDSTRRISVRTGSRSHEFGKLTQLSIGIPQKMDIIQESVDAWDRLDPKPIGAVWLIRRNQLEVDAYSVTCPHLGCSISFDSAKRVFLCPCHESAFALADGKKILGPSPRGLDPLPVEIRDEKVFVTFKKFIQGIVARREG